MYFFLQKRFHFGDKENLTVAALNGLVSVFASWWGGRFAQKFGYFTALKLGSFVMFLSLLAASQAHSATGQILLAALTTIAMCFTWPAFEGLVSEGETPAGLQRMVGLYNISWAGTAALANFTGGAIVDHFGFQSLFYLPAALQFGQLICISWLAARPSAPTLLHPAAPTACAPVLELSPRPIAKARSFLRMAWVANPFAYVAINTVIAVMPGVAKKLELSTTFAGFFCSAWGFARLGAFFGLWFWTGWHYRFRWLLAAFVALPISFAFILTSPNLVLLILAQIVFGTALGLIYYSSLFYSMDIGETKGEHGGIHEAAIGVGNFVGPALGAASLHFLPQSAKSGAVAVTGLLIVGLGALITLWRRAR